MALMWGDSFDMWREWSLDDRRAVLIRQIRERHLTDVNEKQVGGHHYRAAYQHWDWCVDISMAYLEGCATKYVLRWKQKGGRQDLEKARHFVEKIRAARLDPAVAYANTANLCDDTLVQRMFVAYPHPVLLFERAIIAALAHWDTVDDLDSILGNLDILIKSTETGNGA